MGGQLRAILPTMEEHRSRTSIFAKWAGFVLMIPLGFLYLISGLLAPPYAVGILSAIWVLLLIAGIRLHRRRPWLVFAIPFIGLAVWFAVITLGDVFLGWTA